MEENEVMSQEPAEEEISGRFDSHIESLQQQAETLRQAYPDFDLGSALKDPVFLQLTAPGTGISVEDAYYALHRQELQQAAARETREQVVSAIRSGARRPQEAGTDRQGPSVLQFHYENASKEQREAFKKDLRRAWGRGETVYPR